MWVLISSQLRRWVFAAVVVPLVSVLIRGLRRRLEARSGSTKATRALSKAENAAGRFSRKGKKARSTSS